MLTIAPDGKTPDKPTVLGKPNGDDPVQVYATGLYNGIMKGETRWVTGTDVADGLDGGVIVLLGTLTEKEDVVESVFTGQDLRESSSLAELHAQPIPEATEVDERLAAMSKGELVVLAQKVNLEGRSAMDKSELYEHLRQRPDVADHLG